MANIVLTNCNVRGFDTGAVTNWSTFIRAVTIDYTVETHDKTAMRSSGRKRMGGLKDATIRIDFNQDFADDKVDETLYNLLGSSSGWVTIKPTTAVAGVANPRYYGRVFLPGYSPITGNVGDFQAPSVSFQANGLLRRSVSAT